MIPIDAKHDPKAYERKWWDFWAKNDLFAAKKNAKKKPYGILMPPPNVTSQLHMGHGTTYTFQDLLIRWKRMQGYEACWLPGTDHAGIATQMMVEKNLKETEGKTRKDIGRDAFVQRCHDWKDKYGDIIYQQFERIGFSADWQRKAYTMDPHLSESVRYVFVKLFEEGLIQRGERLVNWDPVLQTTISDDEVYSKELNGHLWYFSYPVEGSDEKIPLATTRPETMLGDAAVAVNPEDERYKHLIGKQVRLPFVDRLIPIIADDYVKSEFGTGAVKITPSHDPNDFEMGQRHQLPFFELFNDDASMNDSVPERFRGMDRFVARKEVLRGLKELELFDKEESHKHAVPHSDRSKAIIEPKLSKQWFVNMASLAKPAADAARNEELQFHPESWKKTWLYWLDNIQNWCISRQLWWGHRIPIWYCRDCDDVQSGLEDPTSCKKCQSTNIHQDEDVLDTWFSSWLWPLSPFGWPEQGRESECDFDYFYPSNVLITAPEIIFLWVARMVMAGLKFKGALPFKDIYFTAVVTDKKGVKFSKTLGNGIDPMDVIDEHGADAVRYTGVSMAPLGGRIMMSRDDFDQGARFVIKLWNAARFLFNHLDADTKLKPLADVNMNLASKWLLTRLSETATQVDEKFSSYHLNDGVDKIYHYIWGGFCDWGLECAKTDLQSDDADKKADVLSVLVYALDGALRLAHPLMPFVTEELWQKLPAHPDWDRPQSIMVAEFPDSKKLTSYPTECGQWEAVIQLISSIRSARQQVGLSPREALPAHIDVSADLVPVIEAAAPFIESLANINDLKVQTGIARPDQSISAVGQGFKCYLPVGGLVDFDKERQRLQTEINRITKILGGIDKKLSNENFVARAPKDILIKTNEQRDNMATQLTALSENLKALG